MKILKCKTVLTALLLALAIAAPVPAQTVRVDDTTLQQIIIFGRHSIRSSATTPADLQKYSTNPYPFLFGVRTGFLTPRGEAAAANLGAYFRAYLQQEGLITGDNPTDRTRAYFRANTIQRSYVTAAKFGEGLLQTETVPVHCYGITDIADNQTYLPADPVFDPILGGVVTDNADLEAIPGRALAEAQGVYDNDDNGTALTKAYSAEIDLLRSVLGKDNATALPIVLTAPPKIVTAGAAVSVGGLSTMTAASDPFIMQYADGFDLQDVAWGRLDPDTISQLTRLNVLQLDIAMRLPSVCRVQSSNAASHILRTMQQALWGFPFRGAFGTAKSKILVIISSDYYVAGLAGLLDLHWALPSYQPDFCAPGGALVFELRQVKKTGEHLVRVYYTAQSLDQLRNLTPLDIGTPPETMQLAIPGASTLADTLDVRYATFKQLLRQAIDRRYVQPFREDHPPSVHGPLPSGQE